MRGNRPQAKDRSWQKDFSLSMQPPGQDQSFSNLSHLSISSLSISELSSIQMNQKTSKIFEEQEIDQRKDIPMVSKKLQFDWKSILHLMLNHMLKEEEGEQIQYNLKKREIRGKEAACEEKIKLLQAFLNEHSMRKISCPHELQPNKIIYLKTLFTINVFEKTEILKISSYIEKVMGYEVGKTIKQLELIPYLYLVSCRKTEINEFDRQFAQLEHKDISRSDIQQAKKKKQKVRFSEKQMEQVGRRKSISSEIYSNFVIVSPYDRKAVDYEVSILQKRVAVTSFQYKNIYVRKGYLIQDAKEQVNSKSFQLKKRGSIDHEIKILIVSGSRNNVQEWIETLISMMRAKKQKYEKEKKRRQQQLKQKNSMAESVLQKSVFVEEQVRINCPLQLKRLLVVLEDERVQKIVKQMVADFAKQEGIKILSDGFNSEQYLYYIQVEILKSEEQIFRSKKLAQLGIEICKQIHIQEKFQQQDIAPEYFDRFILIKSGSNPGKLILVEVKQKIVETVKVLSQASSRECCSQFVIPRKIASIFHKMIEIKNKGSKQNFSTNLQINFEDKDMQQSRVVVKGKRKYLLRAEKQILSMVQQIKTQLRKTVCRFTLPEGSFLQKQWKNVEKKISQLEGVSVQLNKNIPDPFITVGTQDRLSEPDQIVIRFMHNKKISDLPKETTIAFFSKEDIDFLDEEMFQDEKNRLISHDEYECTYFRLGYRFIGYRADGEVDKKLAKVIQNKIQSTQHQNQRFLHINLGLFLPYDKKIEFLSIIMNICSKSAAENNHYRFKIYLFERPSQKLAHLLSNLEDKIQLFRNNKFVFYIEDEKGQPLSYSESGNKRITEAFLKNEALLYLTNKDLKIREKTHLCSFKKEKLIHTLTKEEFPLMIKPGKVSFIIKGVQFQMPQQQVTKARADNNCWVSVSISVYQINLRKMVQTNLFSGFSRKLYKKQEQVESNFAGWLLKMDLNNKACEVCINFMEKDQQNAGKAHLILRQLIDQNKKQKSYKLPGRMEKKDFIDLKDFAKELEVDVSLIEKDSSLQAFYFQQGKLQIFEKHYKLFIQKCFDLEYPSYWFPQSKEIQTFVVNKDSEEFKKVQASFKQRPIRELTRIQNKLVYKKYIDEKMNLMKENEGKQIKQLMLFHGTRQTDPKLLYEDRQQSFNINYASDVGYLGKGIYFAQLASYSINYSYHPNQKVKEILYCSVLVGQSQKFQYNEILERTMIMKDTNYKNCTKKIRYESATMFADGSNIYAVYKNRRAYPVYLIKFDS